VTEFGGVIGGGFVWRQIARGLIGLVPGWGIIPKAAIAYSGTYVVGNAILGWYLTGRHLSRKQMKALSQQAFSKGKEYAKALGKKLPKPRLGRGNKGALPATADVPELAAGQIIIHTSDGFSQLPASEEILPVNQLGTANPSQEAAEPVMSNRKPRLRERRAKRQLLPKHKKRETIEPVNLKTCTQCGKTSSADASFCQYCGYSLAN
jgi:hypothetical protein